MSTLEGLTYGLLFGKYFHVHCQAFGMNFRSSDGVHYSKEGVM